MKELEALLKDHAHERPEPPAHDFTYFVLRGDKARQVGALWYARNRGLFGVLVTLQDDGESGAKVLICRRPKCKHCSLKYSDHQPHGGACLFGSTNYTEPPL